MNTTFSSSICARLSHSFLAWVIFPISKAAARDILLIQLQSELLLKIHYLREGHWKSIRGSAPGRVKRRGSQDGVVHTRRFRLIPKSQSCTPHNSGDDFKLHNAELGSINFQPGELFEFKEP
jgi:hypothetical protein